MVFAVPPGDMPVSEIRVRLSPGVIRKVMALVDVVDGAPFYFFITLRQKIP
jgi:hypothetical protein